MRQGLLIFIRCTLLDDHDWTSAAREGERPQAIPKGASYFEIDHIFTEYTKQYCKRCGCPKHLPDNQTKRR